MTPYIKGKRVSWGRVKRLRDKFKQAESISEIKPNGYIVRYVLDAKTVLKYEVRVK